MKKYQSYCDKIFFGNFSTYEHPPLFMFAFREKWAVSIPGGMKCVKLRFTAPALLWSIARREQALRADAERKIFAWRFCSLLDIPPPRFYQCITDDKVLETVANDSKRILLIMAAGTGKTYTAKMK